MTTYIVGISLKKCLYQCSISNTLTFIHEISGNASKIVFETKVNKLISFDNLYDEINLLYQHLSNCVFCPQNCYQL